MNFLIFRLSKLLKQDPPQWLVEASEGKMPSSDSTAIGGWGGSGLALGIASNGAKPEGPYIPKNPKKHQYHGARGKENIGLDDNMEQLSGADDW